MEDCVRKLQVFIHSLLLVTTPSLFAYPQIFPHEAHHEKLFKYSVKNIPNLTYDDILELLHEIESDEDLEEKYSPEEMDQIAHFIAFITRQGKLPGDTEENLSIEQDIKELLGIDDPPETGTLIDNLYRRPE